MQQSPGPARKAALRRAHRGHRARLGVPGGGGCSVAESVCAREKEFRSVCKWLPADNEHEGKQYCVLHFPRVDKDQAAFMGTIEKKLKDKDFDFRGVYFPGKQSLASFSPNATFEGRADFSKAT